MKKQLIVLFAILLVFSCVFVACDFLPMPVYTVTFNLQNDNNDTIVVNFDRNFAIPENVSNGNKVFAGWYTDKECTDGNEWTKPQMLSGNITVYAKWTEGGTQVYNVIFDAQNGTAPVVVAFDSNFAMPADPVNGDKEFLGWYTDRNCTDGNEWTKPETISDNVLVYAKWKEELFTITFDAQNGTEPVVVVFDGNFAMPAEPTKEGYLFESWCTDSSCTNAWTKPETLAENITVYAKWLQCANLSDVFVLYEDAATWNFQVHFEMINLTSNTVWNDDILDIDGLNTKMCYVYDGVECVDYLMYSETTGYVYYVDNGDGTWDSYDEESGWLEYLSAGIDYIDLTELAKFAFVEIDGNYYALDPNAAGNSILGEWEESYWESVQLMVSDGKIVSIVAMQTDASDDYAGSYAFTLSFDKYGEIAFTAPVIEANEDPVLMEIFNLYEEYEKWNFQVNYTVNIDGQTVMDILEMCGYDEAMTYVAIDGNTYKDFLIYDAETDQFVYYQQQEAGSYLMYRQNNNAESSVFTELVGSMDYLDLTSLNSFAFEENGDHYSAKNVQATAKAVLSSYSGEMFTSFDLYIAYGKIVKIVATSVLEGYTDDDEYVSYNLQYTLEFVNYDGVKIVAPEAQPGVEENDEELAEVLSNYENYDDWNFQVHFYMEDANGEVSYDDILRYLGWDFTMQYSEQGKTYTDYIVYSVDTPVYVSDQGNGSYEFYYYGSDEFESMIFYADYVELCELNTYAFTKNGNYYSAVDANSVGNYILAEWEDCVWTSVDLYIADGKIAKIVAVQEDSSEEYAGTYTFTLTFSNYGGVSFTVPEDNGGNSSEGSTTVFTDQNLTTENSDSLQFSASRSADGFDTQNGRGVQFTQKNGNVTLTSKTEVSGVTSVSVVVATNRSTGMTVSVSVGKEKLYCNGSESVKITSSDGQTTLTFTCNDALNGKIYITLGTTGNDKSMYILSVSVSSDGNGGNGGNGGDVDPENIMPEQYFDEDNFDNSNLQQKMKESDGAIGLPSTGAYNALVVPVAFKNSSFNANDLTKLNLAFNGSETDTGWESVKTYYQKSSGGQLKLVFDIYNVVTLNNNYSYYERMTDSHGYSCGAEEILLEVLAYLEPLMDLTQYDTNDDGCIDAVYLIYSVPVDYESDDAFWWAYVTWYSGEEAFDDLYPYYYLFASIQFMHEDADTADGYNYYGTIDGLKINTTTYIHETGHLLGLDDYYDYYRNEGSDRGLGGADMMDHTVGDHNVFSKIMMGWMEPTVITQTQTFTINIADNSSENDCVMLLLDFDGTYFCEYLLIDLYSATGLNALHASLPDSYLYGGAEYGARIYHVSAEVTNPYGDDYGSFTDNNNSLSDIALIKLVEADGQSSSSSKNSGDWASESDLWQTGDSLSGAFGSYTRNDGMVVNFDIQFVEVTATTVTITVTFAEQN